MQAYLDKGRVRTLLDNVPVFAVMTEDLGVRGAYKCAMMVSLETFVLMAQQKSWLCCRFLRSSLSIYHTLQLQDYERICGETHTSSSQGKSESNTKAFYAVICTACVAFAAGTLLARRR